MRSVFILALTLIGATTAQAETFVCQGTGRFSQIGNQTINLQWEKEYQKVLIENQSLKVQVYVDKSNSDGTHYLGIEVMDLDKAGATAMRGAKGSIKDMVLFSDSATSQVVCMVLPGSQLDTAKAAVAVAKKITGADLKSYNCLVTSIDASEGKCQLKFEKNGQSIDLLASPEVAAIYANPTKYAKAPFSNLTLTVSGNEVLQIDDGAGERVSKKIDYSR